MIRQPLKIHAWLLALALLGAGCERKLPEPQTTSGLTVAAAEARAGEVKTADMVGGSG